MDQYHYCKTPNSETARGKTEKTLYDIGTYFLVVQEVRPAGAGELSVFCQSCFKQMLINGTLEAKETSYDKGGTQLSEGTE